MSTEAYVGYAFVVLFRAEDGSRVQQILRAAINPDALRAVSVELPEVRGADFLSAAGAVGASLDTWWRRMVAADSMPIFLALDEPGLTAWIPGTTGSWFVGVADAAAERRLSALSEAVFPIITADPEVVTEQTMQALGTGRATRPVFHPSFPYREAPISWARPVPRLDPPMLEPIAKCAADVRAPSSLGPLHEPSSAGRVPSVPRRPHQPISYEVQLAQAPGSDAVPARPTPRPVPGNSAAGEAFWIAFARLQASSRRLRGILGGAPRMAAEPSAHLGPTINANRPIVAGFASRKGGVGKTTHAAATAATIGEALDGLPDTAALVDGNITNPDAWALHPPPESATVRTLVSRLSQGLDPPPEQYARTPRLAIYPESRESEELYTQAEIDTVAEYLRRRHSFVAVDLPNALPSLTSGGPGAVAAAWLVHCDVVVLPFNADPRARQGLLEYVAVLADDPRLAQIPILAPYIVSTNRSISADRAVQADIAELRRRGVELTEIPDDQNALLALLRDLPINRASPGLRRAYVQMTEMLVDMALRSRRAS